MLVVRSQRKLSKSLEASLAIVVLCQPMQWRVDSRVLNNVKAFCRVAFNGDQGQDLPVAEGEYKMYFLIICLCLSLEGFIHVYPN